MELLLAGKGADAIAGRPELLLELLLLNVLIATPPPLLEFE